MTREPGSQPRRKYADEARKAFEQRLGTSPKDDQARVALGLALAYLGRAEEAIREGQRGVELVPVSKDAVDAPYNLHQLVRIDMVVGRQEEAIDNLERLLAVPYYVSRAWLTIDPNFDPLRKEPALPEARREGEVAHGGGPIVLSPQPSIPTSMRSSSSSSR